MGGRLQGTPQSSQCPNPQSGIHMPVSHKHFTCHTLLCRGEVESLRQTGETSLGHVDIERKPGHLKRYRRWGWSQLGLWAPLCL